MADSAGEGGAPGRSQRGGKRQGAGRPRKTAEEKAADLEAKANAPPKRKYTKKAKPVPAEVTDDEDPNASGDEPPAKKQRTMGSARMKADGMYTIVANPDEETDDHRRRIQELIGNTNQNADLGIHVVRPHARADSRQLWMKYCGNWDTATDMIAWLTKHEDLIRAICADEELGVKVS
jgi:hypothetical protein